MRKPRTLMMMMPFIYLFLQKQKLAYPIYPVGTVDEETTNPEQGPGGDVERFAAQLVYDLAFAHTKLNPTKQGPGGDVERFAAQLVYDSAFALIVRSKSIQDSESVREVLWREREGKRGHTERGGRERERERAWSLNPLLLSIFFLIILLYYY
jgi:hypothetical protein